MHRSTKLTVWVRHGNPCMYIYMYMYINQCVYIYIRIYISNIYTHLNTYTHTHIHIYIYTCININIYIYIDKGWLFSSWHPAGAVQTPQLSGVDGQPGLMVNLLNAEDGAGQRALTVFISQKVFIKSFLKSRFQHESGNLSFTITHVKNNGFVRNWLFVNAFMNTFCEKSLLSNIYGTRKTVKVKSWPWISGKRPWKVWRCSFFAKVFPLRSVFSLRSDVLR